MNMGNGFGMACGFIFSILSAIRYFVIWQDYSTALTFISIGLLLAGFSYLYGKIARLALDVEAMEDYLSEQNMKGGKK